MDNARTIVKNSFFLYASHLITRIVNIVYIGIFARKLGIEVLGDFGLVTTLYFYFVTVVEFGLTPLFMREIATDKAGSGKKFFNILIVRYLFSGLSFLVIFPIQGFLNYPPELKLLIIIYFINIFFIPIQSTYGALFKGHEKYEFTSIITLVSNLIGTAVNLLIIFMGGTLKEIILVSIPLNIIPVILYFIFGRKLNIDYEFKLDLRLIGKFLKKGLVFFLAGIFFQIYLRTDLIILSKLSTKKSVGLYNSAFRIFGFLLVMLNILVQSTFPTMSRLYKNNFEKFKKLFYGLLRILLFVFFPLVIFSSIFSKDIIILIFGKEFISAHLALIPLLWTFFIIAFNTPISLSLVTTKYEHFTMYTALLGAILNIILDLYLIPKYDILGAGLATIIPRLVNTTILMSLFYKYFFKIEWVKIIKIVFLNIILGIGLYFFREYNWVIVLSGYLILYSLLIFIFKIITDYEISLIKGLVLDFKDRISGGMVSL
ncbi:flippase [Candidatus Dependentiae bacterium]|nr:flippase [Candidatus Dependentiae bacterium]